MDFLLTDVKPSKTSPEIAFTATLRIDDTPLATLAKKEGDHWADVTYLPSAENAQAVWDAADAAAQQLGHAHLYAFINVLYSENLQKRAEENARASKELEIRKLCLIALVIKLPRHAEGEYMVSQEAPTVSAGKGSNTSGKEVAKLASRIGSDAHKAAIRAMFSEIMGDIYAGQIEFYNDRYATEQGKLQLVA